MTYKNSDQVLLLSGNQVLFSENLNTVTSSNYPTLQYFLLKLCTRFLLTNVYKSVSGISFILFRSWVINENVKRPGFYALVFYIFIKNSRSKQNRKKIPDNILIKNYWTVGYLELVKVFKFSDKIPGFPKTIELCLNFCMGFCITYLVRSNYREISQ